jgi:hypothetical protein
MMLFIYRGLLFGLLSISALNLWGQRVHGLSAGLGTIYYYGDLSEGPHTASLRPAGEVSYRYYFLPALSVEGRLLHGQIGAADSLAREGGRRQRNLHFRSPLTELSLSLRWDLFPDKAYGKTWVGKRHISPFAQIGLGFAAFQPQARLAGEWVALQPLGTEGQLLPGGSGAYCLQSLVVPVGGGIEWRFNAQWALSWQVAYRFTFTDYLDDLSTTYPNLEALASTFGPLAATLSDRSLDGSVPGEQRGNPGAKDGYLVSNLQLTYLFGQKGW